MRETLKPPSVHQQMYIIVIYSDLKKNKLSKIPVAPKSKSEILYFNFVTSLVCLNFVTKQFKKLYARNHRIYSNKSMTFFKGKKNVPP